MTEKINAWGYLLVDLTASIPYALYNGFAASIALFSALAVLALGKDVSKVKK